MTQLYTQLDSAFKKSKRNPNQFLSLLKDRLDLIKKNNCYILSDISSWVSKVICESNTAISGDITQDTIALLEELWITKNESNSKQFKYYGRFRVHQKIKAQDLFLAKRNISQS